MAFRASAERVRLRRGWEEEEETEEDEETGFVENASEVRERRLFFDCFFGADESDFRLGLGWLSEDEMGCDEDDDEATEANTSDSSDCNLAREVRDDVEEEDAEAAIDDDEEEEDAEEEEEEESIEEEEDVEDERIACIRESTSSSVMGWPPTMTRILPRFSNGVPRK